MKRGLGLIIFTLSLLSSFGQNHQNESLEFFNVDNFLGDTLFIKAQYTECGEWGGHLELSKIYLKGPDFYITYQKFDADCSGIKANNGDPPQILTKSFTKILLNDDKLLVKRYVHLLFDAKLRESTPNHSGYIFQIKKSDNSLNIFVYPGDLTTRSDYETLIRSITE